ncbi:MAG TPA: hypothetical protein VGI95_14405 [Caulobacteraceae bacterium]|jgi:tRNA G10  N-methylase Trm11
MPDQIAEAIRRAQRPDGSIDVDSVVNGIFATPGQKHAFVFNQNARRTNIQIAELLSLVRRHIYVKDTAKRQTEIEFSTFEEVKTFLEEVIAHGNVGDPNSFETFVSELALFFEDKVLVETLYGSACIFLPPKLRVDTALVCGESGYIHSCGDLLILRNAEKMTEAKFKEAIEDCIADFPDDNGKFLLVPYCHEDFSHLDRRSTPFLQHGLDDIKLNISKAFVGATKLYDLLEEVGEDFSDHLAIAPAGDFKKSTDTFKNLFPDKNQNTIFMISDSDLVPNSRFPGSRKFYIMYLQRYKNNNVYHLYDENKPGWASHTTLPHSLAGAMVSIARPWFRDDGSAEVADPFGGSGTVFFEAQKIAGLNCRSSDRAPIFEYAMKDNSTFFGLSKSELIALRDELKEFLEAIPDVWEGAARKRKETREQRLGRIANVVRTWAQKSGGDFLALPKEALDEGFVELGDALPDRLLAYVGLRASVRGVTDLARGTASWPAFFRRELRDLLEQIDNELTWLQETHQTHPQNEKMLVGRASYSPAVSPRPPEIRRFDLLGSLDFEVDTIDHLPVDTYDAIITDPPYGFNTDEDYWQMAAFVRSMVERLVLSLKKEGGQLIMAAPQVSFSGKGIMPFVRATYLAREVVRTCARLGRECVKPSVVLPANLWNLQPPYYWVAEKSLERRILHFWIRSTD